MKFDRNTFLAAGLQASRWIALMVISAVAGEFLVALLSERGFFANPSASVSKIGEAIGTVLDSPWFHWAGGGVVGFAVATIIMDRMRKPPEINVPGWASDKLVKEWRLKVKTLVDFFTSRPDAAIPPNWARDFIKTLLADSSDIWLDDKLRAARADFVRQVQEICDRIDDWNRPNWRTDMEYSETMTYLRDAANRLEAGLSGKPVPPAFDPHG
ncbi:MAG TPA: hypothetical protein VD929_08500 [Caulobacteraceae bacterium]|nr:hypothetical protein [Caulobacteraceae bacterium]